MLDLDVSSRPKAVHNRCASRDQSSFSEALTR